MKLLIESHLSYALSRPCNLLMQLEAAQTAQQQILAQQLDVIPAQPGAVIGGEDGVGTRRWLSAQQDFTATYHAEIEITRPLPPLETLAKTPLYALSAEATRYLMPSRYIQPERFFEVTGAEFGHVTGGAQIAAMRDWIAAQFTYDNGASTADTDAYDSFRARRGVCRDYAHVLIAMARAVAIPARIVSAYGPDVQPQDFHALVEVYLDGAWHLVDPTGMADARDTAVIGVGRDAADISFLTSYGWVEYRNQWVKVTRASD